MKQIKITGIHGYLGSLLSTELTKKGNTVSGIRRQLLYGDTKELANEIKNCDIVINLAGVNILRRWTKKNKALIYDSRVQTTTNLVNAVKVLSEVERPSQLISASAIGIYAAGKVHDETSTDFDNGFVGRVVRDWEKPLEELPESVRTTIFRIAPVLGKESKTISNLLLPFKLGLGGKIASGHQPFPFVHEKDVVKAFIWAIENNDKKGVYNLSAPEDITNSGFTKQLAKMLNRPAFLPVPVFALKLLYGEAAEILVQSPQATPKALLEAGFTFEFPDIQTTLSNILA